MTFKIRCYFTTDGKLGYKGTKMAWFDHNKVMQHMWRYHNNIQSFFFTDYNKSSKMKFVSLLHCNRTLWCKYLQTLEYTYANVW